VAKRSSGSVCEILDLGREVALTDTTFFEKRAEMVAIDWFHQVMMESGRSRLVDIGGIRVA
jgi:hypothetical protein